MFYYKDNIKIIGLTGVIASGKTEVTNYLRKQNFLKEDIL